MLELASYGLTGLAVIVVIGFCFVCDDELPEVEESSFYLINCSHPGDFQVAKVGRRNPGFKEMVGKQPKFALASSPQKAEPVETRPGGICGDGFEDNHVRIEVVHG